MTRFLGGVLLAVVVSSCRLPGAPVPGTPCVPTEYDSSTGQVTVNGDQPECVTDKSVGYCRTDGGWEEVACDRCSNNQEVICTHHVGESCVEGTGYCTSSTSMLFCRDGKYVEEQCGSCQYDSQGKLYACFP